jgi:2-oxoglutarate ferredoxin oxidoreductase subunit beta
VNMPVEDAPAAGAISEGGTELTIKSLTTENPRWCPGCGDFGILMALKRFMVNEHMEPAETVHVSGIGCSGRTPNYIKAYGLHGIHGRAIPIATGLALTRPDLNLFVHSGDGDALSIGGNHLLHGLNKNINCIFVLFNNELYALTKSQTSPTTRKGHKTNTQPSGTYLDPINPVRFALGVGASFVATTADWMSTHLVKTLEQAAAHKGFSFVHVSQRCPHFDPNAFEHKKGHWMTFLLDDNGVPPEKRFLKDAATAQHDPSDLTAAFDVSERFKSSFGIIYRNPDKPCYDDILRAQRNAAEPSDGSTLLDQFRI